MGIRKSEFLAKRNSCPKERNLKVVIRVWRYCRISLLYY